MRENKKKHDASCQTVVVIGMHRSGTSMLAAILEALGVHMGENKLGEHDSNPLGHFEDLDFLQFHERFLADLGTTAEHPPSRQAILNHAHLEKETIIRLIQQKSHGLWGWKDPRNSIFAELYLPYLKNPYFLVIRRNEAAVVHSLYIRDTMEEARAKAFKRCYDERIDDFLRRYPEHKVLELDYQDIVERPHAAIERIVGFLGLPEGKTAREHALQIILDQKSLQKAKMAYKRKTGQPHFVLGIGVQKAGTSTLHSLLSAHPHLESGQQKELHYFDRGDQHSLKNYLLQFPGKQAVKLDVTPAYVFYPGALKRIHDTLPIKDTSIILILRDPVARAYSHYLKSRRNGLEKRSFATAFKWEQRRMKRSDLQFRENSYFERGKYAAQVERLLQLFPREQVHIILFEEFVGEQQKTMDDLCDFLGLMRIVVQEKHENQGYDVQYPLFERWGRSLLQMAKNQDTWQHWAGSKLLSFNKKDSDGPGIDEAFYLRLREYYREDLQKLQQLVGRDLPYA